MMALPPTPPLEGLHSLKERTQGQLLQLQHWIIPNLRQGTDNHVKYSQAHLMSVLL